MGRKKIGKALNVFLNGANVGFLKKDLSGQISFQYQEEWIREGFAISQSLPIQEQEYKGEIVTKKHGDMRGTYYDENGLSYLFDMNDPLPADEREIAI